MQNKNFKKICVNSHIPKWCWGTKFNTILSVINNRLKMLKNMQNEKKMC